MPLLAQAKALVSRSRTTFLACLALTFTSGAAGAVSAADPVPDGSVHTFAILRPRHIPASTAAQLIKPVLSHQAQVALDDRTASLVVSDLAENMEKAKQVLATVDEAVEARDAAAKATKPATGPADAAEVSDPELDRVLERHHTYQAYRQKLDEIALELATAPFGAQHPRAMAMRGKLETLQQQLDDVREELREGLMAERAAAARAGAGALGVGVSRAPEVVGRHLKLPRGAGLVIDRVTGGSPAEAAGLMPYDVLVRLDGQLLVNGEQLDVLLASLEPGKDMQVDLFRDGELLKRTIKLPAP